MLEELTRRIEQDGGISLIIDYGHDGTKEDTFRAFLKHQLHDPLVQPGLADLTADIDFSLIRKLFGEKSWISGPVNQKDFLQRVGIDIRLQKLLSSCQNEDQKAMLQSGYKMLMEDMGERFKLMLILPKILKDYSSTLKVAGFHL